VEAQPFAATRELRELLNALWSDAAGPSGRIPVAR
jgi:hypothetical protein